MKVEAANQTHLYRNSDKIFCQTLVRVPLSVSSSDFSQQATRFAEAGDVAQKRFSVVGTIDLDQSSGALLGLRTLPNSLLDEPIPNRLPSGGNCVPHALPTSLGEQFLPEPPAPGPVIHAVLHQNGRLKPLDFRPVDDAFNAILNGVCNSVGHVTQLSFCLQVREVCHFRSLSIASFAPSDEHVRILTSLR